MSNSEKYICIHGHFYQPPREDAWYEVIEKQPGAMPYHDWNERITEECYNANAESRVLDTMGRLSEIVNNYEYMSFDFGPTLLAWMQKNYPGLYQKILDADKQSIKKHSGHGSAIALCYNHIIMPLANHRDKNTQILWGIRDFEYRFGRKPEGMWLPETAVDIESLDMMAQQGIKFTILAPAQAMGIRRTGAEEWQKVDRGNIDTTMAYRTNLLSGRTINLFFYDAGISRGVAFEEMLQDGENFARRLLAGFSEDAARSQLINIAADGETYGHHKMFGNMALSYAMRYIERSRQAKITNYGKYLEAAPPVYEVDILQNTAWSCVHGLDRWMCHSPDMESRYPGWSQEWRVYLRQSFDYLRDFFAPVFEQEGKKYFKDPWEARDEYISVILDRSPQNIAGFFSKQASHPLAVDETIRALKLMELQRYAMLMYTSCGWFFEKISRIEPRQIMQYAARVIQLGKELFNLDSEPEFLNILARSKSNVPEEKDGRHIYEKYIKPGIIDSDKVAAHFAINSIFDSASSPFYSYSIEKAELTSSRSGDIRLVNGYADIVSSITGETVRKMFSSLYTDTVVAAAADFDEIIYQDIKQKTIQAINAGDVIQASGALNDFFPKVYSFTTVFLDNRLKISGAILKPALNDYELANFELFDTYHKNMHVLHEHGFPVPTEFRAAAEFVINKHLEHALGAIPVDSLKIKELLGEISIWDIKLDGKKLDSVFQKTLQDILMHINEKPEYIFMLRTAVDIMRILPFPVNIEKAQIQFYKIIKSNFSGLLDRAALDKSFLLKLNDIVDIAARLNVALPEY